MPDYEASINDVEPPMSVTHLVQTLRAYAAVIVFSLLSVLVGYTIFAVVIYLFAPSNRVTSQTFRLEFEGADRGTYPNGAKFSTTEIVSTPILLRVFQENDLGRYMAPQEFVQSIFVLESNPDYERMAAEYQARLADPKLTAVDRERIQKEWELRSKSLGKSENSINFVRSRGQTKIPEMIVRKSLSDILTTWAGFAVRERHVLSYDVSVLSPDVAAPTPRPGTDPFIAVQMLRSNVLRVLTNIEDLKLLPSANLVRTEKTSQSLGDVRVQLEDIIRFHLEPLVGRIHDARISTDPAETVRTAEAQLAFDERQLAARRATADAIYQAVVTYGGQQTFAGAAPLSSALGEPTSSGRQSGEGETLVPQMSDSFIDRLVTLATRADDVQYRQTLVDRYREASLSVIPAEQAVAYDKAVLDLLRGGGARGTEVSAAAIGTEIESARAEIRRLVVAVNEIYAIVSKNLNPSTHLFTMTDPPVTRVERAVRIDQLVLYGMLICLVALVLTIVTCLLHNRMREEEKIDTYVRDSDSADLLV